MCDLSPLAHVSGNTRHAQKIMYSAEAEEKKCRDEDQSKECEQLALKKKDVRRNVRKYDRLQGIGKSKVLETTKLCLYLESNFSGRLLEGGGG